MFKLMLVISARIAFVVWLLLIGLVAVGSLLSTPWPFVGMAFSVGGLPFWLSLRGRWTFVVSLLVAVAVTAVPIVLLLDYGADDGGISGAGQTLRWTMTLGMVAYCLVWLGLGIGRIVWLPWSTSATSPTGG